MTSNDAFICDAIRTPFGRYGGALSSVRTDDLAALPLQAAQAQFGAQGQQHIKHHAHTRQRFAFKFTTGLIGVHDHFCRGQAGCG